MVRKRSKAKKKKEELIITNYLEVRTKGMKHTVKKKKIRTDSPSAQKEVKKK